MTLSQPPIEIQQVDGLGLSDLRTAAIRSPTEASNLRAPSINARAMFRAASGWSYGITRLP